MEKIKQKKCYDCGKSFGSGHDNTRRCNICRAIRKKRLSAESNMRVYSIKTDHQKNIKKQSRPCMCCLKNFVSEGKHNRMCSDCRGKSGTIMDRMGSTGRQVGAGHR